MAIQEYFLGGTSPTGFRTRFADQINKEGYYTYILKGGPGTGKSTLMKKVAEKFRNENTSLYRCSSDISSLDAVVIGNKKVIVVDGTSPHVFEADYPGVSQEIINLGSYWDKDELKKHSDNIRYCFDENQKYHKRVKYYVKALASLNTDIYDHAEECLDKLKLDAYINRLSKKLITKSIPNKRGKKDFRQLSAFTTENYKTFNLTGDYSIYFVKDDIFAGGDHFLRKLTDIFTANGYDVVVSECNMLYNTTYEHIICEELGIAFITGNFFNGLTPDNENIINFTRFYNRENYISRKQRINFEKKASLELAKEGAVLLNTALEIHNELEKNYINAIDFKKLNNASEELIKKISETD